MKIAVFSFLFSQTNVCFSSKMMAGKLTFSTSTESKSARSKNEPTTIQWKQSIRLASPPSPSHNLIFDSEIGSINYALIVLNCSVLANFICCKVCVEKAIRQKFHFGHKFVIKKFTFHRALWIMVWIIFFDICIIIYSSFTWVPERGVRRFQCHFVFNK